MNLLLIFPAYRMYAFCWLFCLFGLMPYVKTQATELFDADECQTVYQLSPTEVQLHDDARSQWWFVPYADQPEYSASKSLELTPVGDERFLDAHNDTILIRWQSKLSDALSRTRAESYLIVRNGVPIRDMQGRMVGSFAHLIAKARWDSRVQLAQNDVQADSESWLAIPLRIEQSAREVDHNDRVIPRVCFNLSKTMDNDALGVSAVAATQAQVLGFADEYNMGAQTHLAVMDKGSTQGVAKGQIWFLIEALSKEKMNQSLAVSRVRGQVQVVQVFEQYSLIRIDASEREVMRGTYLKRAQVALPPQ